MIPKPTELQAAIARLRNMSYEHYQFTFDCDLKLVCDAAERNWLATRAQPNGGLTEPRLASQSKWLRKAAEEIRSEGHFGWGNICEEAADAIDAALSEPAQPNGGLTEEQVRNALYEATGPVYESDHTSDLNAAQLTAALNAALSEPRTVEGRKGND